MGSFLRHSPRQLVVLVILAASLLAGAGAALALGPPEEARVAAGAAPGSITWKRGPNPTGLSDELFVTAKGPQGSVYACGVKGWPDAASIWLVKYTASGRKAWSRSYAGPDGVAKVAGMAVDGSGNVYLAGSTRRTSTFWDTVLLKYDSGGHLVWDDIWVAAAEDDEAVAIGRDASGHIFVAGNGYRSGDWDVYVARFRASDGGGDWGYWYDGSGYDAAYSLAVTSAGDCYVAGHVMDDARNDDALLVKVTSSGALDWAESWDAGAYENWENVLLRRGGGVNVAGYRDSASGADLAVARYTAEGTRSWADVWGSGGTYDDYIEDAALARDGSLWVAGTTQRAAGSHRGELVRWDAAGVRRVAKILGSATWPVVLDAVTVDGAGNVYAAGRIAPADEETADAMVVKYTPAGAKKWVARAAHAGAGIDGFEDVVLGPAGYLFACGALGGDTADPAGLVARIRR